MKNLIYLILAFTLITTTSCKKNDPEPYYEYGDDGYNPKEDIYNYYENNTIGYTDGGTIPTGTSTAVDFLVGTKWVLTSFRRTGFATQIVSDTIEFISDTKYIIYINGVGGGEKGYNIVVPAGTSTGNYSLTLSQWFLFGNRVRSYSSFISEDVVQYGKIYGEFTDNYNGDEVKEVKFKLI